MRTVFLFLLLARVALADFGFSGLAFMGIGTEVTGTNIIPDLSLYVDQDGEGGSMVGGNTAEITDLHIKVEASTDNGSSYWVELDDDATGDWDVMYTNVNRYSYWGPVKIKITSSKTGYETRVEYVDVELTATPLLMSWWFWWSSDYHDFCVYSGGMPNPEDGNYYAWFRSVDGGLFSLVDSNYNNIFIETNYGTNSPGTNLLEYYCIVYNPLYPAPLTNSHTYRWALDSTNAGTASMTIEGASPPQLTGFDETLYRSVDGGASFAQVDQHIESHSAFEDTAYKKGNESVQIIYYIEWNWNAVPGEARTDSVWWTVMGEAN